MDNSHFEQSSYDGNIYKYTHCAPLPAVCDMFCLMVTTMAQRQERQMQLSGLSKMDALV